MIDAVSIKVHAINTFGGLKLTTATVANLRGFDAIFVAFCLRALISNPASTPGQREAAQKALEELQ